MTSTLRRFRAPIPAPLHTPPPDEKALSDFMALHFIDPLTFSQLELNNWYKKMHKLVIKASRTSKWAGDAVQEQAVRDFVLLGYDQKLYSSVDLRNGVLPGVLLESTLGDAASLVAATGDFCRLFEEAATILQVTPLRKARALLGARRELEDLQTRQKLITIEHTALQNHFEHFVSFGLPVGDVASVSKAVALYGPLSTLRDEYFTASKPGLLRSYLETVEQIANTHEFKELREENLKARERVRYQTFAKELADKRLPELHTALEVFALMEGGEVDSA